ncbi:ADP-heptose--lipooligosaccharide heptosyltransferase II [invertebrate metagenome]|uniref:ADP-heptose--lipooligosaccharide heptosyltransferase II n=1 Tax=invertebrate metagenome TaxID=1711999 RepID=A0A484HBW4_9ZZZZ
MVEQRERVLIIKLGALGDIVQAMGPFAAIRLHHAAALTVLLTGKSYRDFMHSSPYFDAIWVDERPKAWQIASWLALRTRLRAGRFSMVYDLQTSDRSSFYFRLMGQPPWSGIARGCAYPHANPNRGRLHTLDRQAEQLAMAGLPVTPAPDWSWVQVDVTRFFDVRLPFVLLIAGGAQHRPDKRWPAECYATLAAWLIQCGRTPVLVGTSQDHLQIKRIMEICPRAVNLSGQTSLTDLIGLGRSAVAAVGNDTGPMHLLAASGCPYVVVLYGPASDPILCAPRGHHVITLRCPNLDDLPVAAVESVLPNTP